MLLEGVEDGKYMIGIWMPDAHISIENDSRFAIRVANRGVPWWTTADGKFGVNIIGTVSMAD